MRRYPFSISLLVLLVAAAGCSGDNATPPSTEGNTALSGAIRSPDSSTGGSCDAYVAAVRNVCMDSITRRLDVSCNNQLSSIDIVRQQAAGDLFQVGDEKANARVVESVCERYLEMLQDKRASKDATMDPKGSTGPKCTALAEQFGSMCMAGLGKDPLSDGCRNAARMLGIGAAMDTERRCALAQDQLMN